MADNRDELLAAFLNRAPDSLGDVLRVFGPQVVAVLRNRFNHVLDSSEIEAAFNVAAYKVWSNMDKLQTKTVAGFHAWFVAIACNVAFPGYVLAALDRPEVDVKREFYSPEIDDASA